MKTNIERDELRALLGAALGALRYHTDQTRPIQRTRETIKAIERELTAAGAVEQPAPEIEQLRKDADRYRWLRKSHDSKDYTTLWHVRDGSGKPIGSGELDAAIDAAITKEGQKP